MQTVLFYMSKQHESVREFELFCIDLNHTSTFDLNHLEQMTPLIPISQGL